MTGHKIVPNVDSHVSPRWTGRSLAWIEDEISYLERLVGWNHYTLMVECACPTNRGAGAKVTNGRTVTSLVQHPCDKARAVSGRWDTWPRREDSALGSLCVWDVSTNQHSVCCDDQYIVTLISLEPSGGNVDQVTASLIVVAATLDKLLVSDKIVDTSGLVMQPLLEGDDLGLSGLAETVGSLGRAHRLGQTTEGTLHQSDSRATLTFLEWPEERNNARACISVSGSLEVTIHIALIS